MDKKYSLLVVDDEKDIVDQLYDYFRRDYKIHRAYSGEEAAEILESNEVQLVMTDQRMPKMQGTELLALLKEKSPSTTRILMTGYTDLEVAIEAINMGSIHRYLQKPLNFDELSGIIKEGLEFFEEADKVKRIVSQEKDDILGKIKEVFGKVKNVEADKGKLEAELQAAKDVENKMREEMETKLTELEKDKAANSHEIGELKEEVAKLYDKLDKAVKDAAQVKVMREENAKVQAELKEVGAKFVIANKAAMSQKSEIEKTAIERDAALAEKTRMEKKLKQFQANWAASR